MIYATAQDLIDRFGERELVELTDPDLEVVQTAKVARAIDDAQAYMDSFLARVYALPLTGCVKPAPVVGNPHATELVAPPQLTRIAVDVARYYLYKDFAPENEVYLRYKAAEKELMAIADGKAVLSCPWGGAPGQLVAGSQPGEGEVFHGFSPRRMSDEDLRGFA
jgi:phage gp36-like protein